MKKINDKPMIGINMDLMHTGRSRLPHSVLQSGYYDAILTAGGIPLMIPPLTRELEAASIVDLLDGLVLTGGDDMDPRNYGSDFHPSIRVVPKRREAADRLLCRLAATRKLATLAIGLGMQEMNVEHGGGLYIHIPEVLPRAIPHRDLQGGAHRHIVIMEKGSLMEDIYGVGEIPVSSDHHQGVRKLASMFRPATYAPDGLLEAYEFHDMDEWWCVGVQWHPENEGQISLDTQLFEAFIQASGRRSRPCYQRKV